MKLQRVEIKNFRSIKDMRFTFPKSGFLVLVGANNAGKSNIIRTLNVVCGDQFFGADKVDDQDHYLRDRDNGISISLGFDNRCSARWPTAAPASMTSTSIARFRELQKKIGAPSSRDLPPGRIMGQEARTNVAGMVTVAAAFTVVAAHAA